MKEADLHTLLRDHRGLEGLARELGQDGPNPAFFEEKMLFELSAPRIVGLSF